jgi:hypothetical protein
LNGTQQFFGYVLRPELALMRVQDRLADETDQVTAKFIGDTSGSFVTPLTQGERYSTRLQLGLGWLLSKTAALSVRYQRDQEKDYRSNRAELMLRWDH